MNVKEWKEKISKEECCDEFLFEIKCLKCKSKEVIIDKENSVGCSEYTGMWGDAKAIIKCLECGNAFGITIFES